MLSTNETKNEKEIELTETTHQRNFYNALYDKKTTIKLSESTEYLLEEYLHFAKRVGTPEEPLQEQSRTLKAKFPLANYVVARINNLQCLMLNQKVDIRQLIVQNGVALLVTDLQALFAKLYPLDQNIEDKIYWRKVNAALQKSAHYRFDDDKLFSYYGNLLLLSCFSHHKLPEEIFKLALPNIPGVVERYLKESLPAEKLLEVIANTEMAFSSLKKQLQYCYERVTYDPVKRYEKSGLLLLIVGLAYLWLKNDFSLQEVLLSMAFAVGSTRILRLASQGMGYTVERQLNDELREHFYTLGVSGAAKQYLGLTIGIDKVVLPLLMSKYVPRQDVECLTKHGIRFACEALENMRTLIRVPLKLANKKREEVYTPDYFTQEIPQGLDICKRYAMPTLTQLRKLKGHALTKTPTTFFIQVQPELKTEAVIKMPQEKTGQLVTHSNGSMVFVETSVELATEVESDKLSKLLATKIEFARGNNSSQVGLVHLEKNLWELKHPKTDERVVFIESGTIAISVNDETKQVPRLIPKEVVRGADKNHLCAYK